jgi:hypothetical protein
VSNDLAELAATEFEPQAGLSSFNGSMRGEERSKLDRGLRTSLAFASVFVKLTKTEFVTMLRQMVAVGGPDAIDTADVIETIARDLESAKRQCREFTDLLDAAKFRLLCSAAALELERRSNLSTSLDDQEQRRAHIAALRVVSS